MKLDRRAFTTAALALLATRPAHAEDLEQLLAEIARVRKTVKTLRASFTQERAMKLLATTIKSTGQLAFVAPDRLRWELAPPDDVTYWIGPDGLSYRTKSSQATLPAGGATVARALADLRALLGGDLAPLRERYDLTASRTADTAMIEGTLKAPKPTGVRSFTLVLDKTLSLPLRARLVEGKSDRPDTIDITFSNAAVNVPIDPASMKP